MSAESTDAASTTAFATASPCASTTAFASSLAFSAAPAAALAYPFNLFAAETNTICVLSCMIKYCASIPCKLFIRLAIGLIWFSIIIQSMVAKWSLNSSSKAFRMAIPSWIKSKAFAEVWLTGCSICFSIKPWTVFKISSFFVASGVSGILYSLITLCRSTNFMVLIFFRERLFVGKI